MRVSVVTVAALTAMTGCVVLAAPPKVPPATAPTTVPSDDYQRRMDDLNRRAKEKAGAAEETEIARLKRENESLRLSIEALASTFQKAGLWSGPTNPDELLAMLADDPARIVAETRKHDEGEIAAGRVPGLSVSMALTGRRLIKGDLRAGDAGDYLLFTFSVSNNGRRDIDSCKGLVTFKDKFGDVVGSLELKINQVLAHERTSTVSVKYDYNQFVDADRALANFAADGAIAIFEPLQINFSDGSIWRPKD